MDGDPDLYGMSTGDLDKRGWCHFPGHTCGPHLLNGECYGIETVAERARAVLQYRCDIEFWRMVENYGERPEI